MKLTPQYAPPVPCSRAILAHLANACIALNLNMDEMLTRRKLRHRSDVIEREFVYVWMRMVPMACALTPSYPEIAGAFETNHSTIVTSAQRYFRRNGRKCPTSKALRALSSSCRLSERTPLIPPSLPVNPAQAA